MWIKRTVGVVIIVTMAVTGLILVKGVFFSKINNVNAVSYTHLDVYKRQL